MKKSARLLRSASILLVVACLPSAVSADLQFPVSAKRILFLGDSITHSGGYIAWIETQLRLQGVEPLPEIVNIGLSSETCSGLSEPKHPFPRPDVHERLDRALAKVKPDIVVACYGMNDGIYYPLGEDRLKAYQDGVNRLIVKVHAAGAKLVLLTPPPFDPTPLRGKGKLKPAGEKEYAYFAMYEDYDDVLARYGKWVMEQEDRVEMVIDVHTPLSEFAAEKRKQNPKFTLAPDGIHPNAIGHRVLGETILRAWGVESSAEPEAELLKLVQQRTSLLHDAWLSDVGHKRPGVRAGLPLDEATARAKQLDGKIKPLVEKARQPKSSQRESTGACGQDTEPSARAEESVRPGINDRFLDPKMNVEEWITRFEGESREIFTNRREILDALKLKPGMHAADIGAGTGFLAKLMADRVGDKGWIYAVDISPRFVEHISTLAAKANVANMTPLLCAEDSVRLPPESIDLAYVCDTYHHFEYPKSTLASIHRALRENGTLVVIDFERIPGTSREFVIGHVRAGKEVFRAEIEAAGFEFAEDVKIKGLQENYCLRFRKKPAADTARSR